MKQNIVAGAAVALAGHVVAYPSLDLDVRQVDANFWAAPGPGAVRAPCPGMNTLANHGYINRDGHGITAQALQQGFLDAFGFSFDVTSAGATNAINQCSSLTNTNCNAFDLDQMNEHHAIEHDGSMTRQDFEMIGVDNPNNFIFNATIWGMSLDLYGRCNSHTDPVISGNVRRSRNTQATAADPPGYFVENDGGEGAEHGFILTTMNDPTVGTVDAPQARLDWMNYWFSNERLPTALGWQKPAQTIEAAQFNAIASSVLNAPTTTANCPTTTSSSSSTTSTASSSSSSGSTSTTSSVPFPANNSTSSAMGSGSTPTSTSSIPSYGGTTPTTTPTPTGTASASSSSASASSYSSATSSAKAQATSIVGPQPPVINPYVTVLSPQQWTSYKITITQYVNHVMSLCYTLVSVIYTYVFTSGPAPATPPAGPSPVAPLSGPAPTCPCKC